ncbi:hypothetical protein EDB19DRAFT_1906195 [Suillus lakei]|nr:hypothetical protein EDB19DRAFT_1906195 [Suillus lakei]
MTQSEVRNELTTNEKLDDLEELGYKQSSDSSTPCSEYDPMDGGRRAWATAFGSFLVQFCGFGYINSFGVYQDFYTRIYLTNHPPSAISWIGALTSFLAANVTLISGLLYDRGVVLPLDDRGVVASITILARVILRKAWSVLLDFYDSGCACWDWNGLDVWSQHGGHLSTLLQKTHIGDVSRRVRHTIGCHYSSNDAQPPVLWHLLALREAALSKSTPTASYSAVARKCSREVPFVLMTAGILLCQIGFFFPVFYLQLDSIKHGIDVRFSFYSLVILNAACLSLDAAQQE